MKFFSKVVMKLPHRDLFEMVELALELLPVVEPHSLVCVRLKYFYVVLWEFDHHWDVIIVTVGDQSLEGTGRICCFHEQNVSRSSNMEELFLGESVLISIEDSAGLSDFEFFLIWISFDSLFYIFDPEMEIGGRVSLESGHYFIIPSEVEAAGQILGTCNFRLDFSEVKATHQNSSGFIFVATEFGFAENAIDFLDI